MSKQKLPRKAELSRIESEMNGLFSVAQKQLAEWKASLKVLAGQVSAVIIHGPEDITKLRQALVSWIDEIRIEFVTIKAGENVILYDMPDEFVGFVERPPTWVTVPRQLRECLNGSVQVEAKPTAVVKP